MESRRSRPRLVRTVEQPSGAQEDTTPIYVAAVLDNWTRHDWSEGLNLAAAATMVTFEVVTKRSVYYIVRSGAGDLMVRGGQYLPDFRRARSVGCSLGGALLKQHAVHVGFRMEIGFEDMRLVTSEVTHVRMLTESTEV